MVHPSGRWVRGRPRQAMNGPSTVRMSRVARARRPGGVRFRRPPRSAGRALFARPRRVRCRRALGGQGRPGASGCWGVPASPRPPVGRHGSRGLAGPVDGEAPIPGEVADVPVPGCREGSDGQSLHGSKRHEVGVLMASHGRPAAQPSWAGQRSCLCPGGGQGRTVGQLTLSVRGVAALRAGSVRPNAA